MLDELEPRQFSEWMAAYEIDPWGRETEQIAAVSATIHNELRRVNFRAASEEERKSPTFLEPHTVDHYIPGRHPKKLKRRMSLQEQQQASRRRAGLS